jgi:hypothetical protein
MGMYRLARLIRPSVGYIWWKCRLVLHMVEMPPGGVLCLLRDALYGDMPYKRVYHVSYCHGNVTTCIGSVPSKIYE